MEKATVLLFIISLQFINGSVLLWSSKNILVPTLKVFNDDDLEQLLKSLNTPHLIAIEINNSEDDSIPSNLQDLIKDKNSAYVLNSELNISDKIVIPEDDEITLERINVLINDKKVSDGSDYLGLIEFKSANKRYRRDVESSSPSSSASPEDATKISLMFQEVPSGPQLFKDVHGKAMLYSAAPLVFKSNDSSEDIILGKSSFVSMDDRESYSKLSVTIPVGTSKVILLFRFTWLSGYWTLSSCEVEVLYRNAKYQLINVQDLTAPRAFSYHCGGTTVFTDGTNVLQIFDIQVQPDRVVDGRFSDAYDCVTFTTAPIWSGLLVTSILGIGLAVGLIALGSIKTMDKFDNYKTKQLSITVSE